jgi:hypothetical protein
MRRERGDFIWSPWRACAHGKRDFVSQRRLRLLRTDNTGREIVGDDHTGIDFERLNDSTGTVIFWIAIPVLSSDITMTVLVL